MYISGESPAVCRQRMPLDSGGISSKAGGEFAARENGAAPERKAPKALYARLCRKRRREKSSRISLFSNINGPIIQSQRSSVALLIGRRPFCNLGQRQSLGTLVKRRNLTGTCFSSIGILASAVGPLIREAKAF